MGDDIYAALLISDELQSEMDTLETEFALAEAAGISVPMFEESGS